MKFILSILLFYSLICKAQTNLSFTHIDTSGDGVVDMLRPGAGLTEFGNTHFIDYPQSGVTTTHPPIVYSRWKWCEIQSALNTFNWSDLDSKFNNAIDRNQKIGIGFEILSDAATCNTVGGAVLSYPVFVHTAEQSETNHDWIADGQWVHNWNSGLMHLYYKYFLLKIAEHIHAGSHNGINYYSILYYVDDRGFGNYGEHHLYGAGHGTTPPTGTKCADSSYAILSDATKISFPDRRIFININALNGGNSGSDVSTASGYYVLNQSNSAGFYGIRWDHATDIGTYNYDYTNNSTSLNGLNFKNEIANRWKIAPFIGEPQQFNYSQAGQCDYSHVLTELLTYHASHIENANIVGAASSCIQRGFRAYAKRMGYRNTLTSGQITDSLRANGNYNVRLNWLNEGIAPTYDRWNVTYEFRQSGIVKFSFLSNFQPQYFLPAAFIINDNFTIPSTLSGTYDLYLVIRDASSYWPPMPLQITGRQGDGSYLLKAGIAIAVQGAPPDPPPPPPPNIPPSANAGADITDTLPQTTDTLVAFVSDANGDPVTVLWAKLSGPSVTITSPTSTETTVTGLSVGTYVFRITANDARGGLASDDVTLFVFDALPPDPPPTPPPIYAPPTVQIGNGIVTDTSVQYPADSAYLIGHVITKDTAIQSVQWTLYSYSGQTVGTIVNVNDSTTKVTGLTPGINTAGIYQYRFKVIDKGGNEVFADGFRRVIVFPVNVPDPLPLPGPPGATKVFGIKKPF